MTQPLFPSTIGTQSRSVKFLTIKTAVRKTTVRPGPGAWTRRCFRKAGGGYLFTAPLFQAGIPATSEAFAASSCNATPRCANPPPPPHTHTPPALHTGCPPACVQSLTLGRRPSGCVFVYVAPPHPTTVEIGILRRVGPRHLPTRRTSPTRRAPTPCTTLYDASYSVLSNTLPPPLS